MALAPAEPRGTSSPSRASRPAGRPRAAGGCGTRRSGRARRPARARPGPARCQGDARGPGGPPRRRRPRRRWRAPRGRPSRAGRLAELPGAVERIDDPDPRAARGGRGRRGPPRRARRRPGSLGRRRSKSRWWACRSPSSPDVPGRRAVEARVAGPRGGVARPRWRPGRRARGPRGGGARSGTVDCLPVWSGFTLIAPCPRPPTSSPTSEPSRPRRSTSSARWPRSSSVPRCCSRAARTRS